MIGLSILGMLLVLVLAYVATWYRNRMDLMISYSEFQEEWINDIIDALKYLPPDETYIGDLVREKEARESPLV